MAKGKTQSKFILAIIILAFALSACALPARQTNERPVLTANLSEVEGRVQIRPNADSEFMTADNGQVLGLNGQVLTQDNGKVRIDLSTEAIVRLAPLSLFTLRNVKNEAAESRTQLRLDIGQMWLMMQTGPLEVETPAGTASLDGAYLGVTVSLDGSVYITCFKGRCSLENEKGKVDLVTGQWAKAQDTEHEPESGSLGEAEVEAWIKANPEAEEIRPAVIATMEWLKDPHVTLPDLACLADNSCATFCAPEGWTSTSTEDPNPAAMPEACIQAAQSLIEQGVDANKFLVCVVLINDPQKCADEAKAK